MEIEAAFLYVSMKKRVEYNKIAVVVCTSANPMLRLKDCFMSCIPAFHEFFKGAEMSMVKTGCPKNSKKS